MQIMQGEFASAATVLALPGPGTVVCGDDLVTFALSPTLAVIVIAAGDRPSGSRIRGAEDIDLAAPFPAEAAAVLGAPQTPPLVAFARLPGGDLVALGPVRRTSHGGHHGRLETVGLYIDVRLPDEVLDLVRPTEPAPEQPSLDWLDLLPGDPLAALDRFVAGWFADEPAATTADGPAGGAASWGPAPLRAFHRIAAGRDAVYGLSAPVTREPFGDPRPDGLIPFGHESDGVFLLLFDPAEPDPPVFYDYGGQLVRERARLSEYLLHHTLARAALDGPIGGFALTTPGEAARITEGLTRAPLRPLTWPGAEMHTFVAPGLIIHTGPQDESGEHYELYAGARHRALLRPLRAHDLVWEAFHD